MNYAMRGSPSERLRQRRGTRRKKRIRAGRVTRRWRVTRPAVQRSEPADASAEGSGLRLATSLASLAYSVRCTKQRIKTELLVTNHQPLTPNP